MRRPVTIQNIRNPNFVRMARRCLNIVCQTARRASSAEDRCRASLRTVLPIEADHAKSAATSLQQNIGLRVGIENIRLTLIRATMGIDLDEVSERTSVERGPIDTRKRSTGTKRTSVLCAPAATHDATKTMQEAEIGINRHHEAEVVLRMLKQTKYLHRKARREKMPECKAFRCSTHRRLRLPMAQRRFLVSQIQWLLLRSSISDPNNGLWYLLELHRRLALHSPAR